MHQITPDEGDAIIRASWPARRADIDYSLHTAECGEEWLDDEDAHRPDAVEQYLAILLRVLVCIGALALLAIFWPAK
jgi:hypothetical protein